MKPKQSLTLVELLISTFIISTIIMGVNAMQIGLLQMFNKGIYRALLFQNTSYALERMVKQIEESNSVILPGGPSLQLTKKPATGSEVTSEYYLDSNKKLRYCPVLLQSSSDEFVLSNVKTFTLDGVEPLDPPANTIFRGVRITLEAENPNTRIDIKPSYLQSLAFCRIPSFGLVRVVDSLRTTVKGIYSGIQDAIGNLSTVDTDIVQVSSNNKQPYYETITINNKSLTLEGAYDNTDWSRHLGDPNYETTIDGQQLGSVITCSGASVVITVDGFTVQNGKVIDAVYGGGINVIANNSSSVVLSNNTVRNNTADSLGGGIYADCDDNGSRITISGNTIINNTSNWDHGGGISAFCDNSGSIVIVNNVITENKAPDFFGGGIYAVSYDSGNGAITISNNTISKNLSLEAGGGIFASVENNSHLTITNNEIAENNCKEEGGGAYVESDSSITTIASNIVRNNFILSYGGGGITVKNYYGSFTITNNTITDNDSRGQMGGGGIHIRSWNANPFLITKNTITGNTSNFYGGGIYAASAYETFSIAGNIITDNTSRKNGGGIFANASVGEPFVIANNIIATNASTDSDVLSGGGGIYAATPMTIVNNTITGNISSVGGGGIYASLHEASGSQKQTIRNSICYGGNSPNNIATFDSGTLVVAYSDIGDSGYPTTPPAPPTPPGNINKAPVYVDAANGNYHLKDDITDAGNKYIIDGGDPDVSCKDKQPAPPAPGLGTDRNDMGAYGGPGAGTVGFVMPTADDLSTPDIKENVIGTY